MKAWYPQGTLNDDGTVSFAGDADYRGDGTDDVLLSAEVSGSALEAGAKTLAFKHLTTQLRFTVQGDALFGTTTTVKSITVKGTGVPTGLDLRSDALVYDASAGVSVPGIDLTAGHYPDRTDGRKCRNDPSVPLRDILRRRYHL